MKDDTRVRAMMVTALVLAIAAMLAGPAGARPIDDTGKTLTASERASLRPDDKGGLQGVGSIAARQPVIPYLSQGMGIDAADFGGTGQAVDPTSVIPYLSHDWRVDESQFSGGENSQAATHPAPQSDDRSGWLEPTAFGAAMAGLLLAALALFTARRRHDGKVAV
jgi:hypothetical protein